MGQLIAKGTNKPPVQNYAAKRIQENLAALCRPYVRECVTYYVDVLRDREQSTKDRLSAADRLLERGFGKPVDMVMLASMDGSSGDAPGTLSTSQLIALLTPSLEHQTLEPARDVAVVDANLGAPPAST